jgi:hypothetical protein
MSLQWVEGFELNNGDDWRDNLYDSQEGTINLISGRLHGTSASLSNSTDGTRWITKPLEAHGTWILGIAAEINNPDIGPEAEEVFLGIRDGSTAQIYVYVDNLPSSDDYELQVWRGDNDTGTLLGTSPLIEGGIGFRYFELKVVIHNTTGSVTLKVDGSNVVSITNADTQNTASATADNVRFGGKRGFTPMVGDSTFSLDDMYACNGSGSINNDFLGDQVVARIEPSADGSASEFDSEANGSPSGNDNWEQINENTSSSDEDGGYVAASDVEDKDMYNFDDLPGVMTGGINGVMIYLRSRLEIDGNRELQMRFNDQTNGESDIGAAVLVDEPVYENKDLIVELNPGTTAKFTPAQIDSGQWGYRISV